MNVTANCDRYQVLRPDTPVRWIEGNPSSTGDKYLDPGMGRPGTCGPGKAVFWIGQVAGDDAGSQAKTAGCLCKQDREIAARAPSPVESLDRRLGACVFRGDPATCTDSIRPPIPI